MPIEIKELIIRTTIRDEDAETRSTPNLKIENIVEECVEQVLDILKRKEER